MPFPDASPPSPAPLHGTPAEPRQSPRERDPSPADEWREIRWALGLIEPAFVASARSERTPQ